MFTNITNCILLKNLLIEELLSAVHVYKMLNELDMSFSSVCETQVEYQE